MESLLLEFSVVLAVLFAFLNGFHDGGNVVATSILSRSVSPGKALFFASLAGLAGSMFLGNSVARAIVAIMDPLFFHPQMRLASSLILLSALGGITIWCPLAWWVGIPPSSSHSLIGGLLGGALAAAGTELLNWIQLLEFALILLAAPLAGALAGSLLAALPFVHLEAWDGTSAGTSRLERFLGLFFLGMSHGTNNAQKQMALIGMALIASGDLVSFEIPFWVSLTCGCSLAVGIFVGGGNIAKILGKRVFSIKPAHSFYSQAVSGGILLGASLTGGAVNGVEVIKSSVLGLGGGRRTGRVYRRLSGDIILAWTATLPATALLAAAIYWIASGALGIGMGTFETLMKGLGQ